MSCNGFKLTESRWTLFSRKKFFPVRTVRYWQRLPREAVNALSLEVFKSSLIGILSTLVQWKMSLPWQADWNRMILKVPSNSNQSDSINFFQSHPFKVTLNLWICTGFFAKSVKCTMLFFQIMPLTLIRQAIMKILFTIQT